MLDHQQANFESVNSSRMMVEHRCKFQLSYKLCAWNNPIVIEMISECEYRCLCGSLIADSPVLDGTLYSGNISLYNYIAAIYECM